MKKKIVWLVVSCLTILSLVLAACAPAVVEEKPPKEEAPKVAAPKGVVVEEKVAPSVEKPKYGGRLMIGTDETMSGITLGYDQLYNGSGNWRPPLTMIYDELFTGDWTKGAAGTNEGTFLDSNYSPVGIMQETGSLAESWEIPDGETLIFKIRQGVHFINKPPVNGRELDAKDVAYTLDFYYVNPPPGVVFHGRLTAPAGHKMVSATATDKWTVVVKVTGLANIFIEDIADKVWIVARENIEKWGNTKDWRNVLGTGPFMLTDYVPGSSMMLTKNPNYWRKDPVGPGKGNQLPYIDSINYLIIPDKSTKMAALRTSKVDTLVDVMEDEDKESLLKYNPELKVARTLGGVGMPITIRSSSTSPLAAPLMDKRVRQALAMAIDHQSIIKDYFKGKAELLQFFWYRSSPYYTKLEDMDEILERVHGFSPEDAKIVEKMYSYHPEEAKKMLAEAGYPNGFATTVMTEARWVDRLLIVKEYWKKNLNVDLAIDIREAAVFSTRRDTRQYEAMLVPQGDQPGWIERWNTFGPSAMTGPRVMWNYSDVIDPVMNGGATRFEAVYGDVPARNKIIKEIEPYALQLGWWIQFPKADSYRVWQPWLKNYHGEESIGYRNTGSWAMYAWLDQDMKKSMR